jgi:hypothetical protein
MHILRKVEAFLRKNDMTPTFFGKKATKDPRLVEDLRCGREVRPATEKKILDFMEGYVP